MKRLISEGLALASILVIGTMLWPHSSLAANNPAVTVGDQVVQDSTVVIPKVIAAQNGWIVIHAGDKAGTVLGYSAVSAGENDNVKVAIDLSKATPTISAMLHIDNGLIGSYEFPTADPPVKDSNGNVINVPFKIIGVDVDDQFVSNIKSVTIGNIIAQQDGWVVIHATDKDGTVLGYAPIKVGLNQDVIVDLSKADPTKITEALTAMIHIDAGTIGKYEFPGADIPPALGGTIANEPFWTVDHVRVTDQKLAADGTLLIPYALASKDGWIVIHSTNGGAVIGHAPIKMGLNAAVKVTIDDASKVTAQVSAMLHIDAGLIGTYEFPGPDAPVLGSDGKPISPLFSTTGVAATPGATMAATMPGMGPTLVPTKIPTRVATRVPPPPPTRTPIKVPVPGGTKPVK